MASGWQENRGQSTDSTANTDNTDNTDSTDNIGATFKRPTLRWEAPATREDGSRLYPSDIQEYRVYYRLRHQTKFKVIRSPAGKGSAFALKRFRPGAYEFSVTAVDSEGRESRRSDGVSVDLI